MMTKKLLKSSIYLILLIGFLVQNNAFTQNNRIWSTYYCGPDGVVEEAKAVVTDKDGNVYMAGVTSSSSGVASSGFQNSYGGGSSDGFLVKFDSTGKRLWGTYYGGTDGDLFQCMAIDESGNLYVGGYTKSSNGIASGGFQNTFGGGIYDAFLVKFDSSGNRLWASYYGGAGYDLGISIATDITGNVYLAGWTDGATDIASGGFQNTIGGAGDGFFVKFDPDGNRLYATYYGSTGNDDFFGIAVAPTGNIYLMGNSDSPSGIAINGFINTLPGSGDIFIVKFDASGNRVWGTYFGSPTGQDRSTSNGNCIALDNFENIYVTGATTSTSDIAFHGFQNTYGGGENDAFLVKFNSSGARLWSTYYGFNGGDYGGDFGQSVCVDKTGNVYMTGYTEGGSSFSYNGFQNTYGGNLDGFIVKFNPTGERECATYFGGEGGEVAITSTVDIDGNIYIAGGTYSQFNIAYNGFDNSSVGGDAYLAKFSQYQPTFSATTTSTNPICHGDCSGTANVIASYGVSPYTYSWNTNPIQTNDTLTNLCAGTYIVTVTDATFQTIKDTVIIQDPLPIVSSKDTSICPSMNFTLPSGKIVNVAGVYKDTLISKLTGCDSIVTTNLSEFLLATLQIKGDSSICSGDSATLSVTNYTSYTWNTTSINDTIEVKPLLTTTYSVTAIDANGCVSKDSIDVLLNMKPIANAGKDTTICDNQSITLLGKGGATFSWSNGANTDTSTVFPKLNTQYILTASNGGCFDVDTINVTVLPSPTISVTSNLTTIYQGDSVNLTVVGGDSYEWTPITGLSCSTCNTPIAHPLQNTEYCATASTFSNSCKTTECVKINVNLLCGDLFVPNGFSPNGDNNNDKLEVKINPDCVTDFSFMIFDRWGELLFQTSNISEYWDGKFKGKELDNAVFVYYLKIKLFNNSEYIIRKGNVSIIK